MRANSLWVVCRVEYDDGDSGEMGPAEAFRCYRDALVTQEGGVGVKYLGQRPAEASRSLSPSAL
jgi:hypothetical protein